MLAGSNICKSLKQQFQKSPSICTFSLLKFTLSQLKLTSTARNNLCYCAKQDCHLPSLRIFHMNQTSFNSCCKNYRKEAALLPEPR